MSESEQSDQQRINEVLEIRLAGAQFHEICAYADEQGWNVPQATIRSYIDAGTTALAEQLEGTRTGIINRHLAQRRRIYAKAVSGGDYRVALSILQDEANLLGLYPKKGKSSGDGAQTSISVIIEQQRTRVLDATEQITALPSRDERPATIEQSPE